MVRHDLSEYIDVDAEEIISYFYPTDIVESAEAWDNSDFVCWFWERFAEPRNLMTFACGDNGAISFDREAIISLGIDED